MNYLQLWHNWNLLMPKEELWDYILRFDMIRNMIIYREDEILLLSSANIFQYLVGTFGQFHNAGHLRDTLDYLWMKKNVWSLSLIMEPLCLLYGPFCREPFSWGTFLKYGRKKTEQIQITKAIQLKQQKCNNNFEPHVILYYCDPLLYFNGNGLNI